MLEIIVCFSITDEAFLDLLQSGDIAGLEEAVEKNKFVWNRQIERVS